jgi:hypothetical protein
VDTRAKAGWLAACFVGLVAASGGGCGSSAASAPRICTPGNYVFCRCVDRNEGTKLCAADGTSFDACVCDAVAPLDPDGGFTGIDAAPTDPDAGDAGAPNDTACIGKLVLLGGNAGGLYGAHYKGAGKFTVVSNSGAGASLSGPPAIVPLAGGGFGAVYRDATSALFAMTYTGAFSTPARVGVVVASDAPTLAALGANLHLLYRGGDGKHYRGLFSAGAWDAADTAVTSASVQSFGPSSPTVAVLPGDALTIAYAGADQMLYRQTLTSTPTTAVPQIGTTIATVRPELVAMVDGPRDALVVYASAGDYKLRSTARDAQTKLWSDPILIDPNAYTSEVISLAPMTRGRAMLVYKGANGKPYFSVYDPGAGAPSPWSVLAELVTGANPTVASSPAVALGACGEDAVAAFAQDNGGVAVLRYLGGAWTAPAMVPGLLNFTSVGIAEHL